MFWNFTHESFYSKTFAFWYYLLLYSLLLLIGYCVSMSVFQDGYQNAIFSLCILEDMVLFSFFWHTILILKKSTDHSVLLCFLSLRDFLLLEHSSRVPSLPSIFINFTRTLYCAKHSPFFFSEIRWFFYSTDLSFPVFQESWLLWKF